MKNTDSAKGFTLIELLVVIAVIGLLASVIMVSLNSARGKARDALRRSTLIEISKALELYRNDNSSYPATVGWLLHNLDYALVPAYIPSISNDPVTDSVYIGYQYWRKDYNGYTCMTLGAAGADRYGLYAKLENPTAADLATMNDSFDACVQANWGMNFKAGN
jgi:type II secretion system protein G